MSADEQTTKKDDAATTPPVQKIEHPEELAGDSQLRVNEDFTTESASNSSQHQIQFLPGSTVVIGKHDSHYQDWTIRSAKDPEGKTMDVGDDERFLLDTEIAAHCSLVDSAPPPATDAS